MFLKKLVRAGPAAAIPNKLHGVQNVFFHVTEPLII